MEIGAIYQGHHQCQFVVGAPFLQSIELHLTSPREQRIPLVKEERGYWRVTLNNIPPGTQYYYVLNQDRERPDPASRLQSESVHGSSVVDEGAIHFLKELKQKVEFLSKTQGRPFYLIAESDLNDPKVIRADCGYGLDAQWCDNFQRSLHTLLTVENKGVYVDFGHINHLIKSYREGFVNTGNYSYFRKR